MKTTQRGGLWAAAVIVILFGLVAALRAQTDGQSGGDNPLQPVALTNAPEGAAFFKMSDYFANGGSLGGPYPFMPDTNAPMYSLNGSVFLVDDAVITNDAELSNVLSLLAQPQDAFSSNLLNGNTIAGRALAMDGPPDPTTDTNDSSGGGSGTNSYPSGIMTYPTNVLWIQVPTNALATSNQFLVVLHNTIEDAPYDVLTSTNLALPLSQWAVEQSTIGVEGTNCSPVALMVNGRSNLFVNARFGGSSDGSGIPDWWELQYFGTNGLDPYALDSSGDGWNYMQDYENGFVPGTWHTPPPPQDFFARLDSTGTNVVLTWRSGGGPVDHYEIDTGSDLDPTELGDVDADTFTFTEPTDFDFTDNPFGAQRLRVRAMFTHPDHADTPWLEGPRLGSLNRDLQIFRGPEGQFYLAVQNPTENLSFIHLYWWPDGPDPVDIYVTNLVNGTILLPLDVQQAIGAGDNPFVQLVDFKGRSSQNRIPRFYFSDICLTALATNFVNAAVQMKENLMFLLRSPSASRPFSYFSDLPVSDGAIGGGLFDTPEEYYERGTNSSDYVYYGFHTYSPNLGWAFMEEARPIRENFLWRNFIFDTTEMNSGILASGASGDETQDDAYRHLTDEPAYVYEGSGSETPLPLAFTNASAPWLFFASPSTTDPLALADLGLYLDGSGNLALAGDAFNVYGLQLNSAHFLSTSGYATVTHGGAGAPIGGSLFLEAAQPVLSTVDYYFVSQTPFFNYGGPAPAIPGSPTFSTTNTSPPIITGIGKPVTVSGWAKMAIANGYTNKFAYLEQYFDSANIIDSSGVVTTNSAGLLSPYGEFFPTMAGPAALVTLPDSGQRGTGVVNVVKLQLDVNHDGTMDLSFGGPDNTSQAHPFEFWVNNDNDGVGVGSDSDPMGKTNLMDYFQDTIRSQRNLEDFARLWICGVPPLPLSLLQNYSVTLSWRNTVGAPAINLYWSCETNDGIGYLTNTNVAALQLETNLLSTFGRSIGTVSPNAALVFPDGQFVFSGTQRLLFEGAGVGSGELVLTISEGTNILAQTSQWLDLHDVKDFYERAVITNNTSGAISNWTSGIQINILASSSALGSDTNLVVFVHGFNVGNWDWIIDSETVFKRLYWAGYQGQFASVKWPAEPITKWSFIGLDTSIFNNSEIKSYKAGSALKTYLSQLKDRLPDYQLNVLAHSQGNAITGEAIEQGAPFDTYILTQAAIPANSYDEDALQDLTLLTAEGLYPTPEWQPMGYQGVYTNMSDKMPGRIVNFFNTNDSVLNVWIADQAAGKPDGYAKAFLFSTPYYAYDGTNGWRYSSTSTNLITDTQESRAMISRSLTQAIGRQGPNAGQTGQGVIEAAVDLVGQFEFTTGISEHSAEWTRPIQTSLLYYREVLLQIQPTP